MVDTTEVLTNIQVLPSLAAGCDSYGLSPQGHDWVIGREEQT